MKWIQTIVLTFATATLWAGELDSLVASKPFPGKYVSDNNVFTEPLIITFNEFWNEYSLSDVRYRKEEWRGWKWDKGYGVEYISISPKEFANGRHIWKSTPTEFRSTRHCRFSYNFQMVLLIDGFIFRDSYPRTNTVHEGTCYVHEVEATSHRHEYQLSILELHKVYAQLKETDPERASRWDFFHAVASSDVDKVKRLLADGASAKTKDWRGRTPLMIAAWVRNGGEMVKVLLPESDTAAKDDKGLHYYSYISRTDATHVKPEGIHAVWEEVLKMDNSFEAYSAAMRSAWNIAFFQKLIGDGSNENANNAYVGLLDTHFSKYQKLADSMLKTLEVVLKSGQFSRPDNQQWKLESLSKWLITNKHSELYSLLISEVEDQPTRDQILTHFLSVSKDLHSPDYYPIEGLSDLIRAGVSEKLATKLLARTIQRPGHLDLYRTFVKAGAPLTGIDDDGQTVAMFLAFEGKIDLLKDLGDVPGVPFKAVAKDGSTALTYAIGSAHVQAVRFLSDKSDVDTLAGPKQAPLLVFAAQQLFSNTGVIYRSYCHNCGPKDKPAVVLPRYLEVMKELLENPEYQIKLKATDSDGFSALDYVYYTMSHLTDRFHHTGRQPELEAYVLETYRYLESKGVPAFKTPPLSSSSASSKTTYSSPVTSHE